MLSILRWKIPCEIRGVADEAMPLCGLRRSLWSRGGDK